MTHRILALVLLTAVVSAVTAAVPSWTAEARTEATISAGRYQLQKFDTGYAVVFDTGTGVVYVTANQKDWRKFDAVAGTTEDRYLRNLTGWGDAQPGPNLSNTDASAKAILNALGKGDKDGFRRMVTASALEIQGDRFDEWFEIWRKACEGWSPEEFGSRVDLILEDGVWKINEF